MVKINGTQFPIYDLDTIETFRERLASTFKITPRYIYFPNDTPTFSDIREPLNDIDVENLFDTILRHASKGIDFEGLYQEIRDKLSQQKLNVYTDVLQPFIVFNKTIDKDPTRRNAQLLYIKSQVDDFEELSEQINLVVMWSDRETIIKSFTDAINSNRVKVERMVYMLKTFQQTSRNLLLTTSFEVEKTITEFKLDVNTTLLELFNRIHLNPNVPFACHNGYFKILKDFKPPIEWTSNYGPDFIILRISEKSQLSDTFNESNFTEVIIGTVSEDLEEELIVRIELYTAGTNLSQVDFINRLLECISNEGTIPYTQMEEKRVNGVFYIPDQGFNKYIFADMVMNNPLFTSMISIDESDKATKKKDSLHIYFSNEETGYLTAVITEKIVIKNDPIFRGKDPNVFKEGSRCMRIKVSYANDIHSVTIFQNLFSRLLVIYNGEIPALVEFYKKYIPDFQLMKKIPVIEQKTLRLKDIAPEVFVADYPRQCRFPPRIVSHNEGDELRAQGRAVMRFPKTDENFVQHDYVCDEELLTDKSQRKYPGLRVNKLVNKTNFPFIPCCYGPKNHADVVGTKYRHYFYGEALPEKDIPAQNLILTNKFVGIDKFGTIPKRINKLLSIFTDDNDAVYVRKGITRGPNSFIECVMEATHEQSGILDMNAEQRVDALRRVRGLFLEPDLLGMTRQEMFDMTIEETENIIKNHEQYLDPRMFVSVLERYFNCKIYLFSRYDNPEGELVLPRHHKILYKREDTESPVVLIFEHLGSESDHALYPQCELIVLWNVKRQGNNTLYSFNNRSNIAEGLKNVFDKLRLAYSKNKLITISPPFPQHLRIIDQHIDSYGKCRMINCVYTSGENVSLITSPMQPYAVPVTSIWNPHRCHYDTIMEIARKNLMILLAQVQKNDNLVGLQFSKGYITILVPVIPHKILNDVPFINTPVLDVNEGETSELTRYNYNKKIARHISEYALWLLSRFMHSKKVYTLSSELLQEFFDTQTKISESFVYKYVGKKFDINGGVIENQKLIIPSTEYKKRLAYLLKIIFSQNKNKALNFHKRTTITEYYADVTDFTVYSDQVLLYGEEAIDQWISQRHQVNILEHDPIPNRLESYFIQNQALNGGEIFLAQNTSTLEQLSTILITWYTSGYNVGYNPSRSVPVSFKLFVYGDEHGEFRTYRIKGHQDITGMENACAIGYKIDEQEYFTALLSLGN